MTRVGRQLEAEKRRGEPGGGGRRTGRSGQLELRLPNTWGGKRANAGRKPGPRPSTPHRARPVHRAGEPVHVTLRARVAPLRSQFLFPTVRLALARSARRDQARFRIVHFSVQRDHVHMIVEASDKRALSSGVRSVTIRIARYVNDLLSRCGPLFAERWHGRALKTPREVRNVMLYVLANFRKHARRALRPGLDPYSSAEVFDGWRDWQPASGTPPPFAGSRVRSLPDGEGASVSPRTWLARVGWRKHGLLKLDEAPHA